MCRSSQALLRAISVVLAFSAFAHAGGTSTGKIPLSDLGAGLYLGQYQGGLYAGGANAPPPAHRSAALARAGQIIPLDASGNPDPAGGKIGLISIGMSNTTHEFAVFERQEDTSAIRNARVVIAQTAQGGQTASEIAQPGAAYWTLVQQRITALGMTSAQIQAAWLKEANAGPPNNFPVHAQELRDDLESVANNLHDKFPNLKLCYVSSRTYGGYATGALNPEPQAYESGFSVKWLIDDQINGDLGLNYDAANGPVEAPLLLWGPYLWADGIIPRLDGLTWAQGDFEADGTHPAPSGEQKVGDLLTHFFATDQTVQPWYAAQPGVMLFAVDAQADSYVSAASPSSNFGTGLTLIAAGGASPQIIFLRFDTSAVAGTILYAKLSLRVTTQGVGGGTVGLVSNTSWGETTLTYNNAPPIDGGTIATAPQSSRDGTLGADVTTAVLSDSDNVLAFAIATPTTGAVTYHSREAGQPPRLILTVAVAPVPGDMNCDGRANGRDIGPFVLAILDTTGYGSAYPGCSISNGDLNNDLSTDSDDISPFVGLMTGQ